MFKGDIERHPLTCYWSWLWVVKATPQQFIVGEKILGTHPTGGWVEPRAVLDG